MARALLPARLPLFPVVVLAALLLAGGAHADGDEKVEKARQLFAQGTELVRAADWSAALASFERSAALKPHAITTYNIGACQRAIGSYTRARATFAEALGRNESTHELPDSLADATRGFVAEIDRLVAHATVTVAPADALIAVDGAPLSPDPAKSGGAPRLLAGLRPPGPGEALPITAAAPGAAASFELVLDPGAHVFVLSRKGFGDVVVNRTFAPASRTALRLELDRLPGVMHIASNQDRAVVTVAGIDVGMAPVDVTRPAGSYQVMVKKEGFLPYASQVALKPGDEVSLRGQLVPRSKSIAERWWFWSGIAAVVAGAAVTTYFVTRPGPTRPPVNGGGLGWKVPVQ